MKVIDIFDKVEELEALKDKLKRLVNQNTNDREECTIDEAVYAIDAYIRELMLKEVKE